MNILLLLFGALFFILAWKNFRLATGFFILLLPSYLIRFEILAYPSTLLEICFGILFLTWLIKYSLKDLKLVWNFIKQNKLFFGFLLLFFTSSIIFGIFVSDEWHKSFGHWRAFFLEPIIFFAMLLGRVLAEKIKVKNLIWFLVLSTISISVLAVLQKFFPTLYPPKLWDEEVFGRVTSFFTSPNAVGLYLVPIVVLLFTQIKNNKYNYFILLLSLIALLLTFSQGAWIALAVGILVFLLLTGYRKIFLVSTIVLTMVLTIIIPLRQAVLFQDVSGQNRLQIWGYTADYLLESPQNFVLGTGIRQWFRKIQKPYYFEEDNNLERLTFPHNIFLNFWTEIGLLGMLGFMGILYYLFYFSYKIFRKQKVIGAGLLAMLSAFLVQGLVDVPYFKNDLAFLFWILVILILASRENVIKE